MESSERSVSDGVDAEEEHVLSLRALLHDMVRKKGRVEAARELGLDPRTVGACMDGEGMSWRVREALERQRSAEGDEPGAQPDDRISALERRVDALEMELRSGLEDADTAMKEAVQALREEGTRAPKRMERAADQPKTRQGAEAVSEPPQEVGRPERHTVGRRLYPELVTKEPAPDDEQVYGEAWPLIEEWRRLWRTHSAGGRGLAWLEVELRVRELEVAMLEEHGLTLPPETMPLTGLWRSSQLNWRRETLREVRRAVAWRRLARRILTLNVWRQ